MAKVLFSKELRQFLFVPLSVRRPVDIQFRADTVQWAYIYCYVISYDTAEQIIALLYIYNNRSRSYHDRICTDDLK